MILSSADSTDKASTVHRAYPRWTTALLALLLNISSVALTHARAAGDVLSLLNSPIGQTRDAVLPIAESQWGASARCATTRTGVGMNRRAYFLDTCTFDNVRSNTLYGETPLTSHYYFLEGQLVQIAYEFQKTHNLKKMRRCAKEDRLKLSFGQSSTQLNKLSISVADNGRTVLFNAELVPTIHALAGTIAIK